MIDPLIGVWPASQPTGQGGMWVEHVLHHKGAQQVGGATIIAPSWTHF